ncbi:MAG: M23 family metallopeptidase [Bacteroidia bacterium]|nr:M23 family metallopeptidase [Bacteroidia bacterium]
MKGGTMITRLNYCFSLVLFLFFTLPARSQDKYPQHYFINPLDIPISLAGTFGEIRSNHFHTGLDIRTDSREGLPVHAAAAGYVCRINVSPYGYGHALYIRHPNGFVTVYGHLSRYNAQIAAYVKNKQYELQKFAVDLYPKPDEFTVNKGDTVAFSGSTGGAEGPHLHFEIRDDKTEDPLNPFLFDYSVADGIAPVIAGISFYPLNDSSDVNGSHNPVYMKTVIKANGYALSCPGGEVEACGCVGIGIRTYDLARGSENRNGPYSEVLTDGTDTLYYQRMDRLSFASIRYVNGHVDYAAFKKMHETFEHSFLQDNDKLDIYRKLTNRGIIRFSKGVVHHLKYAVSDFQGNCSTMQFDVRSATAPASIFHDTVKYRGTINWKKAFDYRYRGMAIHIPAGAVFGNLRFNCSAEADSQRTICPVYHVLNEYIPLNTSYTLKLAIPASLPDSLLRRAVVVQMEGSKISAVGGVYDSGSITAHPKTFGNFSVMLDLTRPIIKPVNIYKDKDMSRTAAIELQISDNLSGIAAYNAYIDGRWILMEFNPKKDIISYTFDNHVTSGRHHLKVVVADNVGNTNIYEADFTR